MASLKRGTSRSSSDVGNQTKKIKTTQTNSLHKLLAESGLILKHPPDNCIITRELIQVIRLLKKNIQKLFDYSRNVSDVFSCLTKECEDMDVFKHFLYPNIIRCVEDSPEVHTINDSVFKVLLSIPILQNKLIDYIFEKAMDLAVEKKCGPWIQMMLKCFSTLESIVNTEKISSNLINLLDIASEKLVRLEIITAIPDIIGDQEHDNIAIEMSRFLSEDHDLIPAILECLSYLCLSDMQYNQLQKKTLNILSTLPKCCYFSNFVKFLFMPGRMNDVECLEAVQGLRNALGWPTSVASVQEIATSQVLTATAIRNSIISSKVVGNVWLKAINSCKVNTDHKPIDIIILLILYSTTEDRQKQVENLIRKQVKFDILKENLVDESFDKYKPILKEYLQNLIDLNNSLLKSKSDPAMSLFSSHIYSLMLSQLEDCRQTVIAELLQLALDCKQCVMDILLILTNVSKKEMSLLKPQSLQMLTLLDRMDGMTLTEIRAIMNLVCGLAYSFENSIIRDDIHMIIRKELGSSSPTIKVQGILAGVYAVKYLMASDENEDHTVDIPDDVSYSSVNYLSEGSLREAAQIIELISRSTKPFPDMIAFFYDELSDVVSSSTHINKHFLSWLTDAVTNDLQQNFIVDSIPSSKVGKLKLTLQYCLNADSEMDEVIAINIGGLALEHNNDLNVGIISPLFQLIQSLHFKQHQGDLSSIDALLGCPVLMPQFDIDLVEDMDSDMVSNIIDCLIHCVNWFRELLNAFATQDDEALKSKIMHRVLQIEEIESLISQILLRTSISYKPPVCTFDISKYSGEITEKKIQKVTKQKSQKKPAQDETMLPQTLKSQATQINNNSVKSKLEVIQNLNLRSMNLKLLHLFNNDLNSNTEIDKELNIRTFKFLLKCVNSNLETVLLSKIKRKSFLTKQDITCYDSLKAEECAKSVSEILPKIMKHFQFVTSYLEKNAIDNTQNESGFLFTSETTDYIDCLENLYKMLTIYFKWIGFKTQHTALLKSSLRTVASCDSISNIVSLKDLLISVAKFLQQHEKYCLQISTAVSLIELLKSIQTYSDSLSVLKILQGMANHFLSQSWKTLDGLPEKGLIFNQSVDKLAGIYFLNNEIISLKTLTLQLTNDIEALKSRNATLNTMKCISKNNFPILFRNLGTAVYEATKNHLEKHLTNSEHLDLWKDVVTILKYMADISKNLDSRNNLSAFFKKSVPVLKLFLSQGIPILEMLFKSNTQEVLEILKILQQSTRFLQSLCCHSRLKKDASLISKVPFMRQLLETIIYKVKAALAANNCSEAFWMGNLKNKDIHGEVIATQQSIASEDTVEDCDDQLPEDDDSDTSEEEMLNPDSKSISDII